MPSPITYSVADLPRVRVTGTEFFVVPSFVALVPPSVMATSNTVEIVVRFSPEADDWDVWSLGVVRQEGEPAITADSLREVPPAAALRASLAGFPDLMTHEDGTPLAKAWERLKPTLVDRRAHGPTPANLKDVSDVYRLAQILREPPVLTIVRMFELPQRTATHWVKLSRERGYLKEA